MILFDFCLLNDYSSICFVVIKGEVCNFKNDDNISPIKD